MFYATCFIINGIIDYKKLYDKLYIKSNNKSYNISYDRNIYLIQRQVSTHIKALYSPKDNSHNETNFHTVQEKVKEEKYEEKYGEKK